MNELNVEQREAVKVIGGPLLIVAGPGTGKTKTLTARIAHLVASDAAKPSEILALTFTNKAAAEMRERVAGLVEGAAPTVTTFHALCYRLLGDEMEFVSEPERAMIIKQLRGKAESTSLTTNELGLEISRLKNGMAGDAKAKHLLVAYNQALKERGLCDFDDLLLKTRELLKTEKPDLPYKYILVDEFQDTNALQYELLQLLRSNDNICVIGDPLQSIYGFRGADSTMFDRFAADFPAACKVYLSTNYRSAPEVVRLTNAVFPDSPKLKAHTDNHGTVKAVEVLNEYGEAAWIVNEIEKSIGGSSFLKSHEMEYDNREIAQSFKDFAVLYRTHRVGKTVQKMLGESGIPFQVVGEGSLYERPAIWATIQIMRHVAGVTVALETLPALKHFSPLQIKVLIEKLDTNKKVSELVSNIIETFGFDTTDHAQFIGSLIRFDERGLHAYLQHVDELFAGNFYDPAADAVTLTTIHAAKGLEFNHVFLIAAEEGTLPHQRPHGESDIDEERRLFYVAVSRARAQLDIVHARTRAGKPAEISRFICDIDATTLPRAQDENMATQKRRLAKRAAKRSQGTLFDL